MEGLNTKILNMIHDKDIIEIENILKCSKELIVQQINDSQRTSSSHRI